MNFVKLEETGKKIFSKFPKTRRILKGIYQRTMYFISHDKIKCEGDIQRISPDDGYEYFFGYYDKSPWDKNDRYIISLRVKNAHKVPDSTEPAEIVLFDTNNDNLMTIIGKTHCWNSQQGCMAQWLGPDFKSKIIYNDFRNDKFVSVIYNLEIRKEEKVFDMPIYDVCKSGSFALTLDFTRLHNLRKGYGYANKKENTKNEQCPECTCIWKIDLNSGDITEVLKYSDFKNFETRDNMIGAKHKVNHIMISPNGERFMVLHRWFKNNEKFTRLVTANIDGTDMFNLSDDNFVSHCCWKNDNEILGFLRKKETDNHYYLMKDKSNEYKMLWPELKTDGHCTYSFDGRYVITDTYPNRKRIANVYLCNEDGMIENICKVRSPFKYDNDVRCDLHPRWSHKNNNICFDSVHERKKELYIISLENKLDKELLQNGPLVSVVIPCYNVGKFIEETLYSVQKQFYRNIEIICIDDGSTDDTLDLLKKWKESNKIEMKIISQLNKGVSNSRNVGIKEATGKYIVFLDSDDLIRCDFIYRLIKEVEIKKTDTAYCKLKRDYNTVFKYDNLIDITTQQQKEAMFNLLYKMPEISFVCYIYSLDKIKKNNLSFDENTKYGEDREFNWKYLCHCNKISFINDNMYYYRINNESATKSVPTWRKTDLLNAVVRIEDYLKENNCDFYNELKKYFYSRATWTIAKTFAVGKQKDLYKKFIKEYDVKIHMKRMLKDNSKSVKIGSILYLIHPYLFYYLLSHLDRRK